LCVQKLCIRTSNFCVLLFSAVNHDRSLVDLLLCILLVADLHFNVEMYKRRNRETKEREKEERER